MNYYEMREIISRIIPRQSVIKELAVKLDLVNEKGRKSSYRQYDFSVGEYVSKERLLSKDEIDSFLELSLKAYACPMPLNIDVYDGIACPYRCIYCFADTFKSSLYTSFFDNSRDVGIRSCNPSFYKKEFDKLWKFRGRIELAKNGIQRAIAMEIPLRFGIRFEDFHRQELSKGISLELLKYLAQEKYPVMINTKSDLIGRDDYVKALSDNQSAVHLTLISCDEEFLRKIEPGAPSFRRRLRAASRLISSGIKVVARIEPWMMFINDDSDMIEEYIQHIWEVGISNITFDTYSYSADLPGLRRKFHRLGYDFDRMYLLSCDSQPIASLMLGLFIDLFRSKGFSCSTFDMGNVPFNNDVICCEVGNLFSGFNYGCSVGAAWFISRVFPGSCLKWSEFESWVNEKGGFLSDKIREEVKRCWNWEDSGAYSNGWSVGMEICGNDEDGLIWKYNSKLSDYRKDMVDILRSL